MKMKINPNYYLMMIIILSILITSVLGKHIYFNPRNKTFWASRMKMWLNFVEVYHDHIDLTLYFALFVVKILLRVTEKGSDGNYRLWFQKHVNAMVNQVNMIEHAFLTKIFETKNLKDDHNRLLLELFYNKEDSWYDEQYSSYIYVYNYFIEENEPNPLHEAYANYQNKVYDLKTGSPTPNASGIMCGNRFQEIPASIPCRGDHCLGLIALQPYLYPVYSKLKCRHWNDDCKFLVTNGSDYGFGMTHRLMLLVLARHSRQCYLTHYLNYDYWLVRKLCRYAFIEAQLNFKYFKFTHIELFMEQVAFCGLSFHADMFVDDWIHPVIQLQTEEGCFSNYLPEWHGVKQEVMEFELRKEDFEMLDGICNLHTTAMGGILIALFVRYLCLDVSGAWPWLGTSYG